MVPFKPDTLHLNIISRDVFDSTGLDLTLLTDYILVYSVNLRVDDIELLHSQHPGHRLRLDCPQVWVVNGQLLAVEESPEGVGDQVEQVEEV